MDHWGSWLVGGTAITGFLLSCWRYIQSWLTRLASYVFITASAEGWLAELIMAELTTQFEVSPYGPRRYTANDHWIPRLKKSKAVVISNIPKTAVLYRQGRWRGLLARFHYEKGDGLEVHLTSIRGMFDFDKLMVTAAERVAKSAERRRHNIIHVIGQGGSHGYFRGQGDQNSTGGNSSSPQPATTTYSRYSYFQGRPLNAKVTDLFLPLDYNCPGVSQLALAPEANKLLEFLRHWKEAESWHRERGVPWRYGFLLWGPPGTGKTSFVRGIGEELDFPIYSFDLATMNDKILASSWDEAAGQTPAIILLEDIDNVFNGRDPVNEHTELTFDGLLNQLDGVKERNGLIVVATTNCKDKLDPALVRPGRLDSAIEMQAPTRHGCRKIIRKVLPEYTQLHEDIETRLDGQTGAVVQQFCVQFAMAIQRGAIDPDSVDWNDLPIVLPAELVANEEELSCRSVS